MVMPGLSGLLPFPHLDGAGTMLMMTGWCYQAIASATGNPGSTRANVYMSLQIDPEDFEPSGTPRYGYRKPK